MGFDQDSRSIDKWSADVGRLLERCDRASTHYEVLGLASSADSDDIGRAYSQGIAMLQPAREALQPTGSTNPLRTDLEAARRNMLSRLDAVFGRVTLAYSVLSSPMRRTDYDASLSANNSPSSVPRVEQGSPEASDSERGSSPDTGSLSNGNRRWDRRLNLYIAAQITGYDRELGRWQEPAETVDVSKLGLTFKIRRSVAV